MSESKIKYRLRFKVYYDGKEELFSTTFDNYLSAKECLESTVYGLSCNLHSFIDFTDEYKLVSIRKDKIDKMMSGIDEI